MSRKFLEKLNGDSKGKFSRFLSETKGELNVCWYPSAGRDSCGILYLHPTYAEFFPASESEYVFPDIFLHTDASEEFSGLKNFIKSKVLREDDQVKVSINSMEELPPLKLRKGLDRCGSDTLYGKVFYFPLRININIRNPRDPSWDCPDANSSFPHGHWYLRRRRDDEQLFRHFQFDADTGMLFCSYKAHMIYACVENSTFLNEMLKFDANLSHAVDICRIATNPNFDPAYEFLPDLYEYLPWSGCCELIRDRRAPLPSHGRIIRSKGKLDWVKMKRWGKCDFLDHISNEDSRFLFWDMRKLTNYEVQHLIHRYNTYPNFKSTMIRLIQTNMFHCEFARMLKYMSPEKRIETVIDLFNETKPLLSCHLTSIMPYFSKEQIQRVLDEGGRNLIGSLDLGEIGNDQGVKEKCDALLEKPHNIKYFNRSSVLDIIVNRIIGWIRDIGIEGVHEMFDGSGHELKGVLNFGETSSGREEELADALLGNPHSIKYFDSNSVPCELYEGLKEQVRNWRPRKRVCHVVGASREWYEVR